MSDTSYTLTGPASGEVGRPVTLTVTLAPGIVLNRPVTITPGDQGHGGVFGPTGAVLSATVPSATFSYTPSRTGTSALSCTNDAGLIDPAPLVFTGLIQTGATYGQPGNSATPPYDPTKQITPDFGGANLLNGPLAEYARRIDSDPVEPRNHDYLYAYEEGGNESGALLYPNAAWGNGPQDNNYADAGYAFTVVTGDQPLVTVHVDHPYERYADQSDCDQTTYTVQAPIPPHAAVQGWPSDSPPTQAFDWDDPRNGDLHCLVLDRDNLLLYELYKAYKDPASNDWHCGGIAIFDLKQGGGGYPGTGPAACAPGQLRPLNWTSGNAAGTPMLPLTIRYDEVAAGEIKHAIGCSMPSAHTLCRFVYPARHAAGNTTTPDYDYGLGIPIPFGARFRLKSDWYEANKDRFGPQARVVLDAMRRYGLLLDDISTGGRGNWNQHLVLSFAPDSRWSWSPGGVDDLAKLWTIPVRAFELVQIPVDLTITPGAPSGPVGQPVTLTVAYHWRPGIEHLAPGTDLTLRLNRVSDGAEIGWAHLTADNLSHTFTYTPTEPGPVDFQIGFCSVNVLTGTARYTVLGAATSYLLTGPDPASGPVGAASGPFTVSLPQGAVLSAPVVLTPSDGGTGGTFTPPVVTLSTAQPSATFGYTPGSPGTRTIACTNDSGLSNPAGVLYTALAGPAPPCSRPPRWVPPRPARRRPVRRGARTH